jgi:hypothetical protein
MPRTPVNQNPRFTSPVHTSSNSFPLTALKVDTSTAAVKTPPQTLHLQTNQSQHTDPALHSSLGLLRFGHFDQVPLPPTILYLASHHV